MELIGYSSTDYARDRNNGIKIAGPDYTKETVRSISLTEEANKNGLEMIVNILPVYCQFLKYFGYTEPKEVKTDNSDKKKIYDYSQIELYVNKFLTNFLDKKVYGIYLIEEIRPWIFIEVEFMKHCVIYIYKFLHRYNKKWKLLLYHPTNVFIPDGKKDLEWTMARILSVPYVNNVLVSCYNGYIDKNNKLIDRSILAQKLNFIFVDNIDLKKPEHEYCPVLKLEIQDYSSREQLQSIVLHDFIVCAIYGARKIFVWSIYKRQVITEDKYKDLYNAHINALKEINTPKSDFENKSIFDLCVNNTVKPHRVLFNNGLLIASFKLNNNNIVQFKVNSSDKILDELDPVSYTYTILKNTNQDISYNKYTLFKDNITNISKHPKEFKDIFYSYPDPRIKNVNSSLFIPIIIIITMFLIPFVIWIVPKK